MTDAIHGFHPVFGALLVVLLALLPRAGVVSFEELTDVDFSIVFFLGGVFAIGSGLTETGFTETVARWLLDLLPAGVPLPVLLAFVFGVTIAMTFLLEGLAVASVLTPVLVSYALAVGVPIDPVLMIEAVALGTYFFPYQLAVLVAILGEGIDAGQLIRAVVWTSILATVLLLPLQLGVFALLY